ncbi:MAG: hypothetical protein B7Z55_01100 [Planctomycetales bacterium 12-60-4]|nr:MAG: hypothetical protein B7Z55_01100 [Planctomycetales bacterium 12-60-4]
MTTLVLETVLQAEDRVELKSVLTKPGSLIVDEHFSGTELGKSWVANKGEWQIKTGVLVGREKPEDMHAAVLTLQQPHRNSVIQFAFKLDGATGFNLSFNHAKGHLFRVAANENGLSLTKDADKKDPNSKPKALAKAAGKFGTGKWHTLLVEIQGDRVSVQSDGGATLDVREPSLDVDKTGYRFVMRGESLLIDDIKVWSVEP